MTSNYSSSITDIPKNAQQKDSFGIQPFEDGLVNFIQHTNTPITIALQGEWGSGKTSLMNSLRRNLSESKQAKFHAIWLNTWEYALMNDAQTTLLNILGKLIQETSKIANVDETKTKQLLGKLYQFGKSTATFVAKTAVNKVADGAGDYLADQLSAEESRSTISEIREELQTAITTCCSNHQKENFIFFIDDLDRIDPPVAVQLLELLKNIFTLENCVFILAIDYDVVIKGLEPKFGAYSDKNEREFRSFFDKIIQVPFTMPVTRYEINDFLKDSLQSINYISEQEASNDEQISKFSEIASYTVGSNPRALKRLMNSLSLISCINKAKNKTDKDDEDLKGELEVLVNFALVSIQIAYPLVYRLLSLHPGFDRWNEAVALQMNLKPLDDVSKAKLATNPEFDEDWEQVLFRLCENDFFLKKKSLLISKLLNVLREAIVNKDENIEDIIGAVISLSSVTNLEAFDKGPVDYHRGWFLKELRTPLVKQLKLDLPNVPTIKEQGKRVQSNAYIKCVDGKKENVIKLYSHPHHGQVRLIIIAEKWMAPINHQNLEDCFREAGTLDTFKELEQRYNSFINSFEGFEQGALQDQNSKMLKYHQINPHIYLTLPNPHAFHEPENVARISKVIAALYAFLVELGKIGYDTKTFYEN
ncbi:KAP family P-loop NTPase fold protein [Rasiella sp. SM2506]|uniref:KAP family P-loop NTPase fold protein n=1 Tax=Rasiella sp. SM2506 TaxID=3423914 RepID=UPI003D7902EF